MSTIIEKSLIGVYHVVQHVHFAISLSVLQRFGSAFFTNLATFECSTRREGVSYTYDIFHNKFKNIIVQHAKFEIYALKLNAIFDIANKFPLLLNIGSAYIHKILKWQSNFLCAWLVCINMFKTPNRRRTISCQHTHSTPDIDQSHH